MSKVNPRDLYVSIYNRTFDCEDWTLLFENCGLLKGITMELNTVKSTRFDSPNKSFYILVKDNEIRLEVSNDRSSSSTFYAGSISFRYIESLLQRLTVREVIEE